MPLLSVPDVFGNVLPLETQLRSQLSGCSNTAESKIVASVAEGMDPTIRGVFLRWLFTEALRSTGLPIARLEIEGASIVDVLDLEGLNIGRLLLSFVACDFRDKINLCDATILGFDMVGGTATEIFADRLSANALRLHAVHGTRPVKGPKLAKLRLCGAEIGGNLDLRGCTLEGVADSDGHVLPLCADGITVRGHVLLSDGFNAKGEIRLNGCRIHRNLDCSGATLRNPNGYSLSAAGGHVSGSLRLRRRKSITYPERADFVSQGTLRLEGAKIDGDLDCRAGTFWATAFLPDRIASKKKPSKDDTYAISADGLKVGADVLLTKATAHGTISLIGAHVGSDFDCKKAVFDFPGEEPLVADAITVVGSTFLINTNTNGLLRFVQANLKQGLYIQNATFDTTKGCKWWTDNEAAKIDLGGPACGLYAPDAQVGGEVRWERIGKISNREPQPNLFWLFVSGSKFSCIADDQESWQQLDRFDVTGCDYDSIWGLTDEEVSWRLGQLDRQYAKINSKSRCPDAVLSLERMRRWLRNKLVKRFKPQLYIQLAKTFRAAGYEAAARSILTRLERNKTRYSDEINSKSRYPGAVLSLERMRRWLRELYPLGNTDFDELVKRFKPQPYIQLATTFRAAGFEAAARRTLTRLERNKTRYSDIRSFLRLWRWMLDVLMRYGYSPFRPVLILLTWAAVSAAVFHNAHEQKQIVATRENRSSDAYDQKQIVASRENQSSPTASNQDPDPITAFNAIVYAVDTLVPIVDLNQKKNWTFKSLSASDILLIFNTFFGWLMTTVFAAGVAGLLRTEKTEK
jgi:hypothetical protein